MYNLTNLHENYTRANDQYDERFEEALKTDEIVLREYNYRDINNNQRAADLIIDAFASPNNSPATGSSTQTLNTINAISNNSPKAIDASIINVAIGVHETSNVMVSNLDQSLSADRPFDYHLVKTLFKV